LSAVHKQVTTISSCTDKEKRGYVGDSSISPRFKYQRAATL